MLDVLLLLLNRFDSFTVLLGCNKFELIYHLMRIIVPVILAQVNDLDTSSRRLHRSQSDLVKAVRAIPTVLFCRTFITETLSTPKKAHHPLLHSSSHNLENFPRQYLTLSPHFYRSLTA